MAAIARIIPCHGRNSVAEMSAANPVTMQRSRKRSAGVRSDLMRNLCRKTITKMIPIPGGTQYCSFMNGSSRKSLGNGTIRSAVGIGTLLCEGIGNTIRVSLTADPVREVSAGIAIVRAAGLRPGGVRFVSCPTCGRTEIDLISLASEVESRVRDLHRDITVAVMGCVVNGPGEAREADYGIAGGKGKGLLFRKGVVLGTYPYEELCDRLIQLIESDG